MVRLVNNSVRVITLIDVMLVPGVPTDVSDERFNHPSTQSLLKEKTEKGLMSLAVVEGKQHPEPKTEEEHKVRTKADFMRE